MPFLYRVHQVSLPLDSSEADLPAAVARLLKVDPRAVRSVAVERQSVDARDKADLRLVYGVLAELDAEPRAKLPPSAAARAVPASPYRLPEPTRAFAERPVVVGAGPAGLFAALALAEAGLRPLVLERGDPVDKRHAAVTGFFSGGDLDPESNIQFGEGGAGTYSDGKLTTQVRDERGRDRKVLAELVAAGADPGIAKLTKPHVGTDRLRVVVAGLRRKIESLGGEFRFRARVEGIEAPGGRLRALRLAGGERVPAEAAVLAVGHSARDVFAFLAEAGASMERKAFAVGVRIQHPQEMISRSQYGERWEHPSLPVADYKLAARTADGRGVYSFCMCPGGTVVNSSSERDGVVCNGMSDFSRDGANANSAIVVAVSPSDFGGEDLLSGVEFQRRWERLAFAAGGGGHALPVQLLGDFLAGRKSSALGGVPAAIAGPWAFGDLSGCLPPFAARGIAEALPRFGRSIAGFDRADAVLAAVETRTSSPLRVLRDAQCEASISGLFPCGEGAGYAGGIMSAAMDGLRVAEKVIAPFGT